MECHSLEMKGPMRSGDDIVSITLEADGKVRIYNQLKLNIGSFPSINFNKTLSADTSGGASWQTRSFVKNTVAIFAQASPPVGWSTYDYFTDNSMLVYQHCDDVTLGSGGSDSPISWTTSIVCNDEIIRHTHVYSGTTQGPIGSQADTGINDPPEGSKDNHGHPYSGITSIIYNYDEHNHYITQATFLPKYNSIIAGIKVL